MILPVPCAEFEFFGLFSGGDEMVMVVGWRMKMMRGHGG